MACSRSSVRALRGRMFVIFRERIAAGVRDLTTQIHAGVTPAKNVEGDIGLAPFHDVEAQVPGSVREQIDAVVAGLIDGSITTGVNF